MKSAVIIREAIMKDDCTYQAGRRRKSKEGKCRKGLAGEVRVGGRGARLVTGKQSSGQSLSWWSHQGGRGEGLGV